MQAWKVRVGLKTLKKIETLLQHKLSMLYSELGGSPGV